MPALTETGSKFMWFVCTILYKGWNIPNILIYFILIIDKKNPSRNKFVLHIKRIDDIN